MLTDLPIGFIVPLAAGDGWIEGRLTRKPYRIQGEGTEMVCDLWPAGWSEPIVCTPVDGLYVRIDAERVPLAEFIQTLESRELATTPGGNNAEANKQTQGSGR